MSDRRDDDSLLADVESPQTPPVHEAEQSAATPTRGWAAPAEATTLVLVRHGVTAHTLAKRFSGGLGGDNPGLSEEGRAQVRATAEWIAPLAQRAAAVIASPVRRTLESAGIVAEVLGLPLTEEPAFAEMEFGTWDGLTFAEVGERHPEDMARWLGDLDVPAGGGESFRDVELRVREGLGKLLAEHAGGTVVVVSHVTPIKTLVAAALDAPLETVFRMELSPASVTVVSFYADDRASMRLYNALPPGRDVFASGTW